MSKPRKNPRPDTPAAHTELPDIPAAPPKQTRQYTTFDRFGNIIAGGEVRLSDGTVKHSNAQGHVWLPVDEAYSSEWVVK